MTVVTRMEVWSAAGFGIQPLMDAVCAGRSLVRPVSWDDGALRAPFAALCDGNSVHELLDAVVGSVLPNDEGPIGLVVGTTSGEISGPFEAWVRAGEPADQERRWRQDPVDRIALARRLAPHRTISVACASATAAFDVAERWIRDGVVQRVIVAGVDKLSLYIHAGFGGLGALSRTQCRPFSDQRDGLLLGEGAAAFLLETDASAQRGKRSPIARLLATAITQDGVHLTAPDATGAGLARCMAAVLQKGGVTPEEVDCISAHGTGTGLNDAMEAEAYRAVFSGPVPLHAAKAVIGHALGAAGALEAAIVLAGIGGSELPKPPLEPFDRLVLRPAGRTEVGLSVNAAFGGVNAAVLFARADRHPPERKLRSARRIQSLAWSGRSFPLAEIWPDAPPALGRTDHYVRAGMRALVELREQLFPQAGVVLTSQSNCRAADLRYYRGVVEKGSAGASRLAFPYTVPGAPLAEGAILAGLRGPGWVFCGAASEGREEAERAVRCGELEQSVALHIEAPENGVDAMATVEVAVFA